MIEIAYKKGDKIVKKTFDDCDSYLVADDNSVIFLYNSDDGKIRETIKCNPFITVNTFGGLNA